MNHNYYRYPFVYKRGPQHMISVTRVRLARHIGEDEPDPPVPDPDVPPPPPEPEPVPVPEPEPPVPVPDDPIPPPPPDDYALDEHLYPGVLILVGGDGGELLASIATQKGRYYQIVDEAQLANWALDPDVWDRHLDHTLARHATWRCACYVFRIPVKHPDWKRLVNFVVLRGGVVVIPPGV